MKHSPLYFAAVLLFFCTTISSAQNDRDISRLRKEAQSSQSNKQSLKYSIVDVQEKEGIFTIKYDLNEPAEFEYEVKLIFVRERDDHFFVIPKSATGAIGEGNFAGRGKVITWEYKKDYPKNLDGDDFYFILVINKIEPSNFPWTWIGAGVVAAGGATYFILQHKKEESPQSSEIPALVISRPN